MKLADDENFWNSFAYAACEPLLSIATSVLSCGGHSHQLTSVFAHAMQPEDKHLPSL